MEKHANLIKNLKNENIIKYLDDIMVDNIRFILTPYYEVKLDKKLINNVL